jgi:serine/threonine protein phosphatase PrpC
LHHNFGSFSPLILYKNFNWDLDTVFCGVFDGHGPYGHLVAKKVRDLLPVKLCTQWRALVTSPHENGSANGNASLSISGSVDSEETECINIDEELSESNADTDEVLEKIPEMFKPLKESFLQAFNSMDCDLKKHQSIDCFCSGSTAVTLVKKVCHTICLI